MPVKGSKLEQTLAVFFSPRPEGERKHQKLSRYIYYLYISGVQRSTPYLVLGPKRILIEVATRCLQGQQVTHAAGTPKLTTAFDPALQLRANDSIAPLPTGQPRDQTCPVRRQRDFWLAWD